MAAAFRAGSKGFAFSVLLLFTVLKLGNANAAVPQPHLPATGAFRAWLETQPSQAGGALDLARQRKSELLSLLQTNPAAFHAVALTDAQHQLLPPGLESLVEQPVSGRGSFTVQCVLPPAELDHAHTDGTIRKVHLNGKTYRAYVSGPWKDQQTLLDIPITGLALDDSIVLTDAPPQVGLAKSAPSTTGPNTLLFMIARFSDQTNDPVAEATVLPQMTVVSNFWMNNSSGIVSLRGLVNNTQPCDVVHITLPQPASYASTYANNFSQLLSDARSAASALGFNYASYNLDLVVTTSSGFPYAGVAWIGAQGAHCVAGYTSLRTSGHELGHNLGLWHANYWRTDASTPFGKDSIPGGYAADQTEGEWIEYGHYFSVMSAQYSGEMDDATKPHYSVPEKVRLGWLSGSEVLYAAASGTYRLFRHDARETVGTPRAIRIETPASDYTGYGHRYWLQYRYAPWATAQNWFRNGLEVDVAETGYGSDGAILLDMSPYSKDQASATASYTTDNSDKIDGALVVGRTYDDLPAGIHLTPVATGSNALNEEFIDVVVNLGSFPGNRAPVIASLSASSTRVNTGQSVSFSVSASDPDADTLAYSWDFDDVQVWTASGLNSPTATKSWPTAGQYRVVARVSDMKGGVTTASQIITVGSPANTNQIWGRVLWGGQPVYTARVWTTNGTTVLQSWTDSDGSYILTDLPAIGSFFVNCDFTGLTFTPQFSNPLSTAAGNVYGADFYANEALPFGGANLYAIAGQVTDPATGVSGIEVRAAGIVATTDFSGNYRLTNVANGTWTVAPVNPPWTVSPASRSVTVNSADSGGNNFARVAPYTISGTFSGIPAAAQSPAPIVYLSNGRSVTAARAGTGGNRYWAYSLNNVPTGNYTLTAELSGYNITPSGFSNPLTITGNISGANFVGASSATTAGTVSGRATIYGVALPGVTVTASQSGSTIATCPTDSDGYYRLPNLPTGGLTLTPSKPGYTFTPPSITIPGAPSSGNNFTATGGAAPPVITSVTATPTTVASVGSTTTLSAVASGSGPLTYSWAATQAAGPVAFTANDTTAASSTVVSFQVPGVYTFRARVTDTNGFTTSATVNVTVNGGPGSIAVSPYQVQVPAGQTVAFHADAWDQLGNPFTPAPAWTVTAGGTIDPTGLFTAAVVGGPYQVTATASGLTATAQVWVTTGTTNNVVPAPTIQSIRVNSTNSNVTITWTAVAGHIYRIQYKQDASTPTWTSLVPDITAAGTTATFTEPLTTRRLYRIQVVQ